MKMAMKIKFDDTPFFRLNENLRTAEEVYKAAIYGALHNETQILQILNKTGLETSGRILEKQKYKRAIKTINALAENEKSIIIELNKNQVQLIRKAIKIQLKVVKNVPLLAREQLLITYSTLVEGFVNDVIRNLFLKFPESLKSSKSTLKDSQLIDSIIEGNTLAKLIDNRVREIMYDSITGWIKYLNERGMSISEDINLKEMFLIRNILIHNNKIVGTELANGMKNSKYVIGKKVSVSENDLRRFKSSIKSVTDQINKEYIEKVTK
jgi:competence CoiA-like predicted nuclease